MSCSTVLESVFYYTVIHCILLYCMLKCQCVWHSVLLRNDVLYYVILHTQYYHVMYDPLHCELLKLVQLKDSILSQIEIHN